MNTTTGDGPGDIPPGMLTYQITTQEGIPLASAPSGESAERDAVALLCDMLKDRDIARRLGAANALVQERLRASSVVPCLMGLLDDPDEGARGKAAEILSYYGIEAKEAAPALAAALKDNAPSVPRWAAVALGEIGADARAAVEDLLEIRTHATEARTRAMAAVALRKIDPEVALRMVITHKDLPEGEVGRFYGHDNWVQSVAFSPDGKFALSGSGQSAGSAMADIDCSVRLWDLEQSKEVFALLGHRDRVTSVAFAADGKRAITGSFDETVRIWDLQEGKEIQCLLGHQDRVRSVAISPNGKVALSGGCDHTVRLWNLETGREVFHFPRQRQWVLSVAFSPDGRIVLTGGADGTVRLWDLHSGHQVGGRREPGLAGKLFNFLRGRHRNTVSTASSVTSIDFDQSGQRSVTGGMDRVIRLWDFDSGEELKTFRGHQGGVSSVLFAADGQHLLSGGMDKTVRFWDIATGKEMLVFEGHTETVNSVALSPNGRQALSGSADKTVRLWQLPG